MGKIISNHKTAMKRNKISWQNKISGRRDVKGKEGDVFTAGSAAWPFADGNNAVKVSSMGMVTAIIFTLYLLYQS